MNEPSRQLPRFVLAILAALTLQAFAHRLAADSLHETIAAVQPRMVKLFGAGGLRNLEGYGTGFLVSPNGHIVTVWSHLLDTDAVAVVLHDGRRFYGKVIGTDAKKDLAVLKIDAVDLPYFELSQAVSVGPGARILAFSNMFKVAAGDEPMTVVHGVVSAKTHLDARRGRYEIPYNGPVYILDATTNNPGAAGGVLTTDDGKLLGMLGREVRSDENHVWLNYAMPIGELRPAIEDIVAGRARRNDPLAETGTSENPARSPVEFGIVLVPDVVFRTPAYIQTVIEGSQADKLGLRPDDLIVFVNGELVNSIRVFDAALQTVAPGDDLNIVIRRGEELVNVTFRVPRENP